MGDNEFKPITSQEELDAVLKDRLNRQSEKHSRELSEKLASFEEAKTKLAEAEAKIGELNSTIESNATQLSDLQSKYDESTKLLSEKDATLKKYERDSVKNAIATEYGIPAELANRLTGETEEEMRADAELLKNAVGLNRIPPLAKPMQVDSNSREAALRSLSEGLK